MPQIELTPAQTGFLACHITGFGRSWTIETAGQAGSDRRFVRVRRGTRSYVLVIWNREDRDWARFISIAAQLRGVVPYLPDIHAVDELHGLILEEDLGTLTLHAYVSVQAEAAEPVAKAYRQVLDALVRWQGIGREHSPALCSRSMDRDMFLWESEYFTRHCVVEFFGLEKLTGTAWEKERSAIADRAASFPQVFIHRDFQSENVMMTGSGVRFVDFQGGRLGPAGYDLASLLYDPYADCLDAAMSAALFDYYRNAAPGLCDREQYRICAVQRLMQALGAYGNLSLHKGKDRYRAFVKPALERLAGVVAEHGGLPVLSEIVSACAGKA